MPTGTRPAAVGSTVAARGIVIALAGGWLITAAALLLRLVGGLLVVRALRTRARPLEATQVRAVAESAAVRVSATEVEWLQSSDIDAPAAVGWFHPAVLLPARLPETASAELLLPLLAHELEHVRRRDTIKAAALEATGALLFHCPGVRWLSCQVRAAREEICDDVAVRVCGEPTRCAEALASLVGVQRAAPALGAIGQGGPSLSARIRRILKGEEEMRRLTGPQVLLLALLVVAIGGASVALTSVALVQSAAAQDASAAAAALRPPSGYVRTQLGAPVSITASLSDGRYVFQVTRVRNVSEQRVTGLRFVAVVPDPRRASPVRIVESEMVPTSLEPGQSAELRISLLPTESLAGRHAQPTLALVQARFDDGDIWAVTPDRQAREAEEALYLERASVAPALIGANPPVMSQDGACRDHRGLAYSPGAVVPVLGSQSEWARCDEGTWVAYPLSEPGSPAMAEVAPKPVPAHAACPTPAAALRGGRLDEPIGLKFQDADLAKVLETIGKLAGVRIVGSSELHYRVDVVMSELSTRQALESLASSQRLSYCQDGDTITARRAGQAKQ